MTVDGSERRIVVGIDDSDVSVDAFRWAVDEAVRRGGVAVDVVGVWDVEQINVGIEMVALAPPHGQAVDRLARIEQVMEWIRPERDGITCTAGLLKGSSGPALCEHAEGAELLVLGRPLHGGTALGSPTVNHVLRHAPCPVVFVPSRARTLAEARSPA